MMTTARTTAHIINRKGLHARASARLAELALTLPTEVTLSFEGETASARSIMDLLCLGAGIGSEVEISADGEGADAAIAAVTAMFTNGFGELADDEAAAGEA
jgi:phosphocarrier protein